MTEIEKYNLAFSFKESGNYTKAIGMFRNLLDPKSSEISKENILFQIGGCYYFDEKYSEALTNFLKAQKLDDSSESTSLGIYLSLVGLNRTEDAIKELDRFSTKYRIELYRDTIQELLIGISKGQGTDFKDIIYSIKERHDISIKSSPSG